MRSKLSTKHVSSNERKTNRLDSLWSMSWLPWIFVSVFIRLILFNTGFDNTFQRQVEFTTPTTSFRRLIEGLHLITLKLSPYSSSMFIQPPLILLPFIPFYGKDSFVWFSRTLYIALDLIIAYLMFQIAKMHKMNIEKQNKTREAPETAVTRTSSDKSGAIGDDLNLAYYSNLPHIIAALYLFNPAIICSCVSLSTVIFNNLALAGAVYFAMKGNIILCSMSVSFATYLSIYPIVLLVPIALIIQKSKKLPLFSVASKICVCFVFWESLWLFLSYSMMNNSLDFMENAYIYPLSIQDLTPNWSNFWYMFTEIFDYFRKFFLIVFHIHHLAYIAPLTIKFKDDPTFLCLLFIGIISIFKAYATFGDTFFYITLLMMYSHLTKYMRYGFFILVMMAYAMIIGPACFRTWIYKGTGNANFFYFITLLFLLSQTLLIVEFIYAKLKERHELKKQANN